MSIVARHDIDAAWAMSSVEMLEQRLHEAREDIEVELLGPRFAMSRSLEEFGHRCVDDPRPVSLGTQDVR